jgi:hypothetical protein
MTEDIMDHKRPVNSNDREILLLLHSSPGQLVLAPVFLNGEARQAFAIMCENESGVFLRILGVALNSSDTMQDQLGQAAMFTPPKAEKDGTLN